MNAASFTWTYRGDGQPSAATQPNGNATTFGYDAISRATSKLTQDT